MANVVASLLVKMGLDAVEYTTGLTKAEYQAKKFANEINKQFRDVRNTLIGLASAFGGISVLKSFAEDTIAAASALDDLADSTGSSVENLSKLANQAKVSGVDFATLQGLMNKLAAGMNGVDEEGSKVGTALKALGVTAKDPAQALEEVAAKLNEYADGTAKAALARDLFGKGGPAFLAMLKDLAEAHGVAGTVTAEQAAQAELLEKNIRRLQVESTTLANILLTDLVPQINAFITGVKLARAEGLGWFESLNIGTTYIDRIVPSLDALYQKIANLRRLQAEESGPGNFLRGLFGMSLESQATDAQKQINVLQKLKFQTEDFVGPPVPKKTLNYASTGGGSVGGREAKQAIADYTNEIQKLKDAMDPLAQQYPKLTEAQQKIMADMQAGKTILWETADAYLRASRSMDQQAISAKELAEAQKILDEEMKQAEAIEKRATDAVGAYAEQLDAFEKGIGIIGQGAKAYDLLNAEIEHNKRLKLATADTVGIENAQYERQKKLIDAYHEANEVLQQQIELNRIFADSLSDALVNVVEGTKSLKDAFKDMARSIVHELNVIAARNTAKALLGGNDQGGGGIGALIAKYAPGIISSLFSGPSPNFGDYATGPGAPQTGGPGGGLAGGTDYWRGGPTWVGERGPEILNLPAGSQVIPSDESRRMAGTTNVYHINVMPGASSASVRQTGDMLRDVTMKSMRSR